MLPWKPAGSGGGALCVLMAVNGLFTSWVWPKLKLNPDVGAANEGLKLLVGNGGKEELFWLGWFPFSC